MKRAPRSRIEALGNLILYGSERDARDLNRVLNDPPSSDKLLDWLLDDYEQGRTPKVRRPRQKVRRGVGSY